MTTHSRRRRDYRLPDERDDEEIVGKCDVGGEEEIPVSLEGLHQGVEAEDCNDGAHQVPNIPVPVSEHDKNTIPDTLGPGTQQDNNDNTSLHPPAPLSTATLATTTTPSTNRLSSLETADQDATAFLPIRPLSHLYIVTTAHFVRSGPQASIEAPAIRSEVIAVCIDAERAREIAWQTWRAGGWGFGGGGGEGEAEVWDGVGVENLFRDGRRAFGEGGWGWSY